MTNLKEQQALSKELKKLAESEGFNPVGIARVPGSNRLKLRTAALQRWLQSGFQGEMHWMESERRQNIESLLEGVKSVISVGLNYYVNKKPEKNSLLIGRFGWGKDYHKIITKKLKRIGHFLEAKKPNCKWRICVDSSSLLEKAWAEEAGLGWIGKHSNLINTKRGSWFLLGHLLCTEPLTPDIPAKANCGECEKCINACPTNAISEPFIVNSKKCIAYHTIENRSLELPENIIQSLNNWVAGCDICQDICPWNNQSIPSSLDPDMQPAEWILNTTKEKALTWSEETWKKNLQGSTLKRMKTWMWRRNINALKSKNNPLK